MHAIHTHTEAHSQGDRAATIANNLGECVCVCTHTCVRIFVIARSNANSVSTHTHTCISI